jgi:hypothetical protein
MPQLITIITNTGVTYFLFIVFTVFMLQSLLSASEVFLFALIVEVVPSVDYPYLRLKPPLVEPGLCPYLGFPASPLVVSLLVWPVNHMEHLMDPLVGRQAVG